MRWIKATNALIRSLSGKVKNLMEWVKEIKAVVRSALDELEFQY